MLFTLQPGQWAVQVLSLLISPDLGSVNIYQGPGPAEGGGGSGQRMWVPVVGRDHKQCGVASATAKGYGLLLGGGGWGWEEGFLGCLRTEQDWGGWVGRGVGSALCGRGGWAWAWGLGTAGCTLCGHLRMRAGPVGQEVGEMGRGSWALGPHGAAPLPSLFSEGCATCQGLRIGPLDGPLRTLGSLFQRWESQLE